MSESDPQADLTKALLDAVRLFEALGIGYALVGGLAAMYYGRARFTEDVDFIATDDHEDKLKANPQTMRQHQFDPTCTWKLYHDSGVQIDLWKDTFVKDMVARASEVTMAGQRVRIVEVHDLVAMKLRANRVQDDYDISEILTHTSLDDSLVRQRVTAEQHAHLIEIRNRNKN